MAATNWVHNINGEEGLSVNDKIKELVKMGDKLVLVQQHELATIQASKHKERYTTYVDILYKHYVTNDLPKTYLT
jgi:hypothetical protein